MNEGNKGVVAITLPLHSDTLHNATWRTFHATQNSFSIISYSSPLFGRDYATERIQNCESHVPALASEALATALWSISAPLDLFAVGINFRKLWMDSRVWLDRLCLIPTPLHYKTWFHRPANGDFPPCPCVVFCTHHFYPSWKTYLYRIFWNVIEKDKDKEVYWDIEKGIHEWQVAVRSLYLPLSVLTFRAYWEIERTWFLLRHIQAWRTELRRESLNNWIES